MSLLQSAVDEYNKAKNEFAAKVSSEQKHLPVYPYLFIYLLSLMINHRQLGMQYKW